VTSPPRPIDQAFGESDPASKRVRTALIALYVLTGVVYLSWRLTVFNPDAFWVSALFYAIELGGFLGSLLLFFVTFLRRTRTPRPAPKGLSVDVFVTTHNEDLDLVRRTVVAAIALRYPHVTWLLDDGDRSQFRALAAELGCHYLARAGNQGAKAGNLNNALTHSHGEFVALFDADHCADPLFLDRLLGYFDDPLVAFVQTPQDYYNLNSFQHGRGREGKLIWHEQSGFHHVEQPGRDYHDAATLCGCSCVLRRSHVEKVGGFPEETVTEDMHLAVKLQKRGLKTVYHDEPLAFGVAPPDLIGFLVQRLRWGEGNMQVCRIEHLPFARGLTRSQNLNYLLLGFAYFDSWRKLAFYVAPIGTLITDIAPVFGVPHEFILFFVPYLCCGIITYWELYAGFGRVLRTEAYAMARLGSGLLATWGLFRRRIHFRVSSKRLVSRSALPLALPQAAIFLGGLFAIGVAALHYYEYRAGLWLPSTPFEIVAALVILVGFNCLLALFVLIEAARSARTNEPDYRFDLCLPVRLTAHQESVVGWTSTVWLRGARLPIPESFDRTATFVAVELFIPGGSVKTTARVNLVGRNELELQFNWGSLSERDRLDQTLHAGRWHRVVTGRHEASISPLEKFGLRPAPRERWPEGRSIWEPILVRHLMSPQDLRLAYLRGGRSEILLFEAADGLVEVAADRARSLTGQRFALGERADTPLLDETALESRGGARHRLRAVEFQEKSIVFMPISAAE
jgi:cellulose synthase/poly-beta-1,6-N-acetylglucosamine synthase-like glycosyltransferase